MTKQDIIDYLTNDCGLHRASAIRAVDGVINAISSALAHQQAVTLRGFGTLKPIDKAEKIGRNIKTDQPIVIPAHRSVKLIVSKELKALLNSKN